MKKRAKNLGGELKKAQVLRQVLCIKIRLRKQDIATVQCKLGDTFTPFRSG